MAFPSAKEALTPDPNVVFNGYTLGPTAQRAVMIVWVGHQYGVAPDFGHRPTFDPWRPCVEEMAAAGLLYKTREGPDSDMASGYCFKTTEFEQFAGELVRASGMEWSAIIPEPAPDNTPPKNESQVAWLGRMREAMERVWWAVKADGDYEMQAAFDAVGEAIRVLNQRLEAKGLDKI